MHLLVGGPGMCNQAEKPLWEGGWEADTLRFETVS